MAILDMYRISQLLLEKNRKELSHICSVRHNSLVRDGYDKMKKFSWDMLYSEYVENIPTLVSLISAISPTSSIAVRCTISYFHHCQTKTQ